MTVKNKITAEMLARAIDALRQGVDAAEDLRNYSGTSDARKNLQEFEVVARVVIELAEEKRLVPKPTPASVSYLPERGPKA